MNANVASGGRRAGVVALLAAILVAVAGPAVAVERGAYIAVDYGKFRFDSSAAEFAAPLDPFLECAAPQLFNPLNVLCSPRGNVEFDTLSMSKRSRGYDLWVGYQFSHWFGVEGAYLEMGKVRHAFSGTFEMGDVNGDGPVDGLLPLEGRSSLRTRGAAFAGTGNLELGDYFSLDARAGFFFVDRKWGFNSTISGPDGLEELGFSQSQNKTSLFYGASANFWITPYYSLRGGFTAYSKGPFDGTVRHIRQYFIGIRYSYGY